MPAWTRRGVLIEVADPPRPTAVFEFRPRGILVEVWRGDWLLAVFDRSELRAWLDAPGGALVNDEVLLEVDARGRPIISARWVIAREIQPDDVAALRAAL
jgi:hypothetical protein